MAINSAVHVWREAEVSVYQLEDGPPTIALKEGSSDLIIFFQSIGKFEELFKKMREFKAKEKQDDNGN